MRIYEGADGHFTLYEDEGDNYNYEKGKYATIDFLWNDKARTLTIKDRKGAFPGMLPNRTFNVVVVNKGNGRGMEVPGKFDKVISYSGKAVTAKIP